MGIRYTQPQENPRINWANPITRSLAAVISARSGQNMLYPVAQNGLSGAGIAPTPSYGLAADFIGKASTSKVTTNFLLTSPNSTTPGDRTYFMPFLRNGNGGGSFGRFFQKGNNECYLMEDVATNTFGFVQSTSAGGNLSSQRFSPPGGLSGTVGWHTIAVTITAGGTVQMYQDGVSQGLTAVTYTNGATTQTGAYVLGNRSTDNARVWNGQLGDLLIFDRVATDDEILSLHNNQNQIYKPTSRRLWVVGAGGGAAALAGNATAQASATGSLTTAIPIAAAVVSISTASAALSTAIPLSGAAASVASSNGSLTAQIRLTADALAQAIAGAALSSGIILTANAVAQAAAQGTLSTLINLIANAQGSASASASLTAGSSGLSADAQATATASASLTAQIRLSAAAVSQATATADLTTGAIPFTATALSIASASGALTTSIKLAAVAVAVASATATLFEQTTGRLGGFEYGSKVYIKRNKKIYIFDSVEEADSYLEAEAKAEEIVQQSNKTSRLARKRAREKAFKSLAIEPVESVDIPALKTLVAQLQTDFELPKLIAKQDWQRVVEIYNQAMEMQDEEDLLLIL